MRKEISNYVRYVYRKLWGKDFQSMWNLSHLLIRVLIKGLKTDERFFGALMKIIFHWIVEDCRKQPGKLFESVLNFYIIKGLVMGLKTE